LPGQIEHARGKHRADGMNSVVPVKPFVDQPLRRALHRGLVTRRDLVFDNRMHHGVHLGVWQTDPCAAVIVLHQQKALVSAPHRETCDAAA
jgi:hypothetical protein